MGMGMGMILAINHGRRDADSWPLSRRRRPIDPCSSFYPDESEPSETATTDSTGLGSFASIGLCSKEGYPGPADGPGSSPSSGRASSEASGGLPNGKAKHKGFIILDYYIGNESFIREAISNHIFFIYLQYLHS
jgi:hypothetical protein